MANTETASSFWPAPAKINHFLHVTGRRDDGYHLLQTVFQFLDLADELRITATPDGRIRCRRNYQQVAEQDDLVVRAAKLLQELGGSSKWRRHPASTKRFQSAEDWEAAVPMRRRPWWP